MIRFKVKPLFENTKDVTVLVWSDVLKDNCRVHLIRGNRVKQGQWYNAEFRGLEVRVGGRQAGSAWTGAR